MSNKSLTAVWIVYRTFSGNKLSALFGFFIVSWITLAILLTVYHKVTPEDHELWKKNNAMEWEQLESDLHWAKFPNECYASPRWQKENPEMWADMKERWKTKISVEEVHEQDVKQIEQKIADQLFMGSKMAYFYDVSWAKSAIIIVIVLGLIFIYRVYEAVEYEVKDYKNQKVADDYLEECERQIEIEDAAEIAEEERVNNAINRRNRRKSSDTDYLE